MENPKTEKRLSKALAAAGVASRRAAEELIFAGRVKVNGKTIRLPQHHVSWETDTITVDNKPIAQEEKKHYFLLNKPAGYECTCHRRNKRMKMVVDLFTEIDERLFTVGRLDRDTEGLLIVTNDGHFGQKVLHPSSNIAKEYVVKTDQEILERHLVKISEGTIVEGVFVKPLKVIKVRKGTVKVIISEGRKHEVRILVSNADLEVKHLKRTRIGGLRLGTLPVGSWRPLTETEKEQIFQ